MIIETDVEQENRILYEQLARRAVAALNKRGLHAEYVADRQAALSRVLEMIPEGAVVGLADSVTLYEVGVISSLRDGKRHELADWLLRDADGRPTLTGAARFEAQRKALMSDVFLTGMNAITLDGRMVSIDSVGNRVAAMIFGPKKVIVVAGGNKVVKTLDDAIRRVKEVASPLNLQRHYLKHHMGVQETPCFKSGICVDCNGPHRTCNYTVIIEGERAPHTVSDYLPRIHVVLVGEKLGF